MTLQHRRQRRCNLEHAGDTFTTKNTDQSTHGAHQTEHVLESEGSSQGGLHVDGRHGNAVGGVAPPRRDKYACLISIVFMHFDGDAK